MWDTYTFPAASNSFARSLSLVLKDKFPTNTFVLPMMYVDGKMRGYEGLRGHTKIKHKGDAYVEQQP